MALTASTMLPLGTQAPDFHLPDVVSGKSISLATFAEKKALLVMFICQHCPFVKHIKAELAQLGKDYIPSNWELWQLAPMILINIQLMHLSR
jgi:thiol-disulfide isomerase/thioredoxin